MTMVKRNRRRPKRVSRVIKITFLTAVTAAVLYNTFLRKPAQISVDRNSKVDARGNGMRGAYPAKLIPAEENKKEQKGVVGSGKDNESENDDDGDDGDGDDDESGDDGDGDDDDGNDDETGDDEEGDDGNDDESGEDDDESEDDDDEDDDESEGDGTMVTKKEETNLQSKIELNKEDSSSPPPHQLAGLSCEAYGGPNDSASASEMVYWSDIPTDSTYKSPFYDKSKYITFEPDHGGWNNIRMGMETILVMAHAMGRTLVLPPEKQMYLLRDKSKPQKNSFSFQDFFHLESVSLEHTGLDIITMEEFLKREGTTGNLINPTSGEADLPTQTDWNGKKLDPLWQYLRTVGHVNNTWNGDKCMATFPSSTDPQDVYQLHKTIHEINDAEKKPRPNHYDGKPIPVDSNTMERLKENLGGGKRNKLCIYDKQMQEPKLVHFVVDPKQNDARILQHFYGYVFFQDWRDDLRMKRFVRDHIRYIDEIMCAAARVVKAVREKVKENNDGMKERTDGRGGEFDSFHIRRGDFQYKNTRVSADVIYENSEKELMEGSTIYVATDERDKSFFDPLRKHYKLLFLDDFKHLLEEVNTNYYGMLDQLIASRGRVFFGTFYSTLTGYITRLRGYHAQKLKLEGHHDGVTQSYYFIPKDNKYALQKYKAVALPLWMREFPTVWREIDFGVEEIKDDAAVARKLSLVER